MWVMNARLWCEKVRGTMPGPVAVKECVWLLRLRGAGHAAAAAPTHSTHTKKKEVSVLLLERA